LNKIKNKENRIMKKILFVLALVTVLSAPAAFAKNDCEQGFHKDQSGTCVRNENAATPATPATPADPGVTSATPAEPATPSSQSE
jgi:hypothetical protein